MSDKLEALRRGYEAFNRADFATARETVTDDVHWGTTGSFASRRAYTQKDAALEAAGAALGR